MADWTETPGIERAGAWLSPRLGRVPGVRHGFGGLRVEAPPRLAGEPWETRAYCKQVHGAVVREARGPNANAGEADGLFSADAGVAIGVITADCVPILAIERDGGAVAALHAGWRGSRAGIALELGRALRAAGHAPQRWVAAVGPAIGPCCYEVSAEIASGFVREFPAAPVVPRADRPRYLDLAALNAWQLREAGFGDVEVLRRCTRCSRGPDGEWLYHSYRREGAGTRQWSSAARFPGQDAELVEADQPE